MLPGHLTRRRIGLVVLAARSAIAGKTARDSTTCGQNIFTRPAAKLVAYRGTCKRARSSCTKTSHLLLLLWCACACLQKCHCADQGYSD